MKLRGQSAHDIGSANRAILASESASPDCLAFTATIQQSSSNSNEVSHSET